jgi:nucleoside-diphosphate-sugar epimerase
LFVAGATGAIGRQLVPMLIARGHDVVGTTRSEERARWLTSVGAVPAIVDVFDVDRLHDVVIVAKPDVVLHQLTDLAAGFGSEQMRATARLREVGTGHLVAASLAAGIGRFVAQNLYGPGTASESPDRTPSVHIVAAARAALLAAERGPIGVYDIVDDDDEVSDAKARALLTRDPSER